MKPSPAALKLADKIERLCNLYGNTSTSNIVPQLATLIDESNKELVGALEQSLECIQTQFGESLRGGSIATRTKWESALANNQPKPE
jgi:hypothetical protein